ncbi:MAG: SH3 domain-containing protein [Thermodesulfobacteriota bacterium]|nr:SH3 domain-containing protein [Thermodesulfobacteriota bacterium]
MKKDQGFYAKFFMLQVLTFGVALSFVLGCAGGKPEQKPTPPVEEKVEQPKKEETLSPSPTPEPSSKPAPPTASPSVSEPPKVTSPPQPLPSPPSSLRTTKVVWDSVNLREGPGLNFRVIGNAKKGTSLSILEEKGSWLRVRLQDGSEAWVSKAATSEAPKPTPGATPKPKPM